MSLDDIGGWFPAQNRAELELLIAEHRVRSVLEIGSFLGLSAAWFARRVEKVTCVDRWHEPAREDSHNNLNATLRRFGIPRDFFQIFESNMREFGVWDKIRTVRGDSKEVHGEVGDHDLVYIDGDHSYAGCLADIRLYAPKARMIVCGDDYLAEEEFDVIGAVRDSFPAESVRSRPPFWWVEK